MNKLCDRNSQIVRIDSQQIQIEKRVDVGAKQPTVCNRIRVLSKISLNVGRFENRNEATPGDSTAVPVRNQ